MALDDRQQNVRVAPASGTNQCRHVFGGHRRQLSAGLEQQVEQIRVAALDRHLHGAPAIGPDDVRIDLGSE